MGRTGVALAPLRPLALGMLRNAMGRMLLGAGAMWVGLVAGRAQVPGGVASTLAPPATQALVTRAVETVLSAWRARAVRPEQLAVTLVDLRDSGQPQRGSFRGETAIYPASVIKLFYLAAVHQWLEEGRLTDTAELRRALRDMIVDSSNDATHYLVDLLTATTSGPELSEPEITLWFEKRNAVNRFFAGLGYTGINVNKKPWGDGPYGRETQAMRLFAQKRNMLTTDATARLLAEIATGKCVNERRSAEMMTLLSRVPMGAGADEQAKFTGPALPAGSKLWSKAGWTSTARHDAAYIELPGGAKFVLVVFTTDLAQEADFIGAVARTIIDGLTLDPRD